MTEIREGYVTAVTPDFEVTAHGDFTSVPVAFVADGLTLVLHDRVAFTMLQGRPVVLCRLVAP